MSLLNIETLKVKYFLIISSLLLAGLITSGPNHKYIVTEKGIEGVVINESRLQDVKKVFPGGKTEKDVVGGEKIIGHAKMANGECVPITAKVPKKIAKTYSVKKTGISFYFNFNNKLSEITVWGKGKFKTDKGIIIGESRFKDLDSLYGYTHWGRVKEKLVKVHGNIIFESSTSDKSIQPNDSLIIDKIQVLIN